MTRVVADLGNSRMKWARVTDDGRLEQAHALSLDDPTEWKALWKSWHPGRRSPVHVQWAISSVNPPLLARLLAFLDDQKITAPTLFESAAAVPLPMDVDGPETGGSDRALSVLAAIPRMPAGQPGIVIMCGTAITLERVSAEGVWQGGVIAPGLFLTSRALHLMTAQLPLVRPDRTAPSWGRGTTDCLQAGIYWGMVGAVKELIARQTFEGSQRPWIVWTGGDAEELAVSVEGSNALVIPDLVLHGVVLAAFKPGPREASGSFAAR
jgi:type III pantothenate kinase